MEYDLELICEFSQMPIMLESALTSNVFIVSQMLFNRFPENFFIRLLGVWEVR